LKQLELIRCDACSGDLGPCRGGFAFVEFAHVSAPQSILNHPWIPTSGPDAVTVRGFIYDVDTGKLEEVSYPGPMGTFG
jgi:hypothetical protein